LTLIVIGMLSRDRPGLDRRSVDPLAGQTAGRHPNRAGELPVLFPVDDLHSFESGAIGRSLADPALFTVTDDRRLSIGSL
jgi:hypothetical protein